MKVYAIGGYSEVGKNMTAIEVNNKVVIFDIGLYLPAILRYEEGDAHLLPAEELVKIGAIPDDSQLKGKNVIGIVLNHGHLDHIGAVPYLAKKYNCPIFATRYTAEIMKSLNEDKNVKLKVNILHNNSSVKLDEFKLEFIHMTHSIPETCLGVLHTSEGKVVYCNDYKFDNHPTIGKKPNYDRLKEISNIKLLIMDSLNSKVEGKTPSESVARELLKDVMLNENLDGSCVIITTFSIHIARLKSIIEISQMIKRKVVFMGRSLEKYTTAAENIDLVKFSKDVEIIGVRGEMKRKLKEIQRNRDRYVLVVTGNQGEPASVLTRMAEGEMGFEFSPRDMVIFSCRTIPSPETIDNRAHLEGILKEKGVRMFKQVHVSGHAAQEDHRDMIDLLKPEHIIPSHGGFDVTLPVKELALEMGYKENKIHVLKDYEVIEI